MSKKLSMVKFMDKQISPAPSGVSSEVMEIKFNSARIYFNKDGSIDICCSLDKQIEVLLDREEKSENECRRWVKIKLKKSPVSSRYR